MAKKAAATTETGVQDGPKESQLDKVFKPFLPTHHVSFAQLKDILSQLAGDGGNGDDDDDDELPAG
jgi:hypothetical protein